MRNNESRFALNPTNIDISRSRFDRSSNVKTSFNVGDLVPFYIDEVYPGDTFDVSTAKVVRLPSLLTAPMDNLYLDTYYFFVPNRLVWEHWQEFNGENTSSAWIPAVEYSIPQVTAPSGGWNPCTIADYLGIPIGVGDLSVNALPFRSYALVVDSWFRDQNLMSPVNISTGDSTVAGSNGSNYITDLVKGGKPFVCAKYHDYFTSCLPSPQKGPDVSIGITGDVPVFGNGNTLGLTDGSNLYGLFHSYAQGSDTLGVDSTLFGDPVGTAYGSSSATSYVGYGVPTKEQLDLASEDYDATGLIAALGSLGAISINQLRLAFQIQKLYEKDARGGTRYIEILKSHFGVTSPDARLQRPEYLGGNRLPLNISQVIQNSETSNTPQGNVAGYSLTADNHSDFTRSFVEHGFIIGLCVARYDHTYQQGLERFWSRTDRFDYYWPALANIGEQAVLNKEIYAQGSTILNPVTGKAYDDEVFGYNEAWADLRYKPNRTSGQMRSEASTVLGSSLDKWHFGDDYASLPSLSASWLVEDKTNVDRVLAVTSALSNQLFVDFYIKNNTTRPLPLYSIPGLIDHH